MRYRPLCAAFIVLVLVICVFHWNGWKLWGMKELTEDEIARIEKCRYITGTVSERWKSADGYVYILSNTVVKSADHYYHPGKLRLVETDMLFETGTKIKATGRCSIYGHESNPGGFDKKTYYAADGICGSFVIRTVQITGFDGKYRFNEFSAVLREKLTGIFNETMGEKCGAILSAMITGERGDMDENIRVNYTVSGLGHLLAISGLHVGIAGMALLRLLMLLRIRRSAASVAASAALLFYCLFTGAHDSTLRAFIMFSVMAGARCLLRSYDMPSSLSLAGIILLLLQPQRLFVAGFLLSFCAAGGLAVFYPIIRRAFHTERFRYKTGRKYRLLFAASEGFLVWLSVNLATIPVLLNFYSEFALYGVLANILFVPMTTAVILLGIAGGAISLAFPAVGKILLFVPKILVSVQDGAGEVLRRLPCNVLITGKPDVLRIVFYCLGLFVISVWMKYYVLRPDTADKEAKGFAVAGKMIVPVCSVILMMLIFIPPAHGFAITALDVGQGDCIVITDGSGHTMLVDGGSSSTEKCGKYIILPYLKAEGISKLEGVFVSHNDSDHMNGIMEMMEMRAEGSSAVRIERLFMPIWMIYDETGQKLADAAERCGTEIIYLKKDSALKSGDVSMKILFPEEDGKFTGNEGSLVIGLSYENFTALFTGDLEGKAEEEVTAAIGHYDYLKAAHHGSGGSTSAEFLAAVQPSVCLISAPKRSIYNHPSPETLARIEDAGAAWFQTGKQGAVTVRYRDGKIRVSTYRYSCYK